MKTFYFLIALLLTAAISKAQLTNTKWQGDVNIPSSATVIFDFKKDTVNMILAENSQVVETMAYSVKDSVITMKKTNGLSPCNVGDVFKVKYVINGDKLYITSLSDPCDDRVSSWTKEPLIRVKQ
jgi:hypothetical protein